MSAGADSGRWADVKERGHYWGMALLVILYRVFGRWLLYPLVGVVVTYFFLTRRATRRYSALYLRRVLGRRVRLWDVWRHHLAFGASLMDRIAAWMGRITRADVAFEGHFTMLELARSKRGAVLLGAHFGVLEMCRAVVENDKSLKLNVIVHDQNTRKFNRVMARVNRQSQVRVIPVQEITPATAIHLRERLDEGEFVILLADRLPPGNVTRTLSAPFLAPDEGGSLGRSDFTAESSYVAQGCSSAQGCNSAQGCASDAPDRFVVQWPAGPFWLALMLGAPVYFIAACHTGFGYQATLKLLYEGGKVARREREAKCYALLQDYIQVLEKLCRRHPYQWFNFYDFWGDDAHIGQAGSSKNSNDRITQDSQP